MVKQKQDHETRFTALLMAAFELPIVKEDWPYIWTGKDGVPVFCYVLNKDTASVQVVGTSTVFYRDRIETTDTGPEDW